MDIPAHELRPRSLQPGFSVTRQGREEVLVGRSDGQTWEVFQGGEAREMGLWRDLSHTRRVPRGGFLGWLGFTKAVVEAPDGRIDPNEVRPLWNPGVVPEKYSETPLPPEAAPKLYRLQRCSADFELQPETNRVRASVKLQGEAVGSPDRLSLDFHSFPSRINALKFNDRPVEYERSEEALQIRLPRTLRQGEEFQLQIDYEGSPHSVRHPAVPAELGWLAADGAIVTMNGVEMASSWIPSDNRPDNKAVYDFAVRVPRGYRALANGALERITEDGDRRVFHYSSRFPMASYLVSVNCFDEKRYAQSRIEIPGGPDVELTYPREMEDKVKAGFSQVPRMMKFLEDRIGAYPFETCGAVVADLPVDRQRVELTDGESRYMLDSPYGIAFEAQTRPVFTREVLQGTLSAEITILHELAHQWFGNAVTKKTEKDLWVNEAFPSYSGYLWIEQRQGPEAMEQALRELHESLKEHRFTDTAAAPERDKLFSEQNYARMALSMHALRKELGDQEFYGTLRDFFERYRYGSASVEDFIETANRRHGDRLQPFFDRWLRSTELPPYPGQSVFTG
ncbi:MAG: M1 family metallopeptidase [Armatimonadetes bacterium]|nr:M1 family metallopeptidase [Armatimonadota bacterium]